MADDSSMKAVQVKLVLLGTSYLFVTTAPLPLCLSGSRRGVLADFQNVGLDRHRYFICDPIGSLC